MSQAKKPSPIIKVCLLGMAGLALMQGYNSTSKVNDYIVALPVTGAPAAQEGAGPPATTINRNLVPLLVESRRKRAEVSLGVSDGFMESGRIDELFGRKPPLRRGQEKTSMPSNENPFLPGGSASAPAEEPPKPLLVDYFKVLPSVVELQAITSQGAVVNGRLFSRGEDVTTLRYPSPDGAKVLVPILVEMGPDFIVLGEHTTKQTHRISLNH